MHAVPSMDIAAGTPTPKGPRPATRPPLAPFSLRKKLGERDPAGDAPARNADRFATAARRGKRRQEAGGLPNGRQGQDLMDANLKREGLRALDLPFAFG